MKRMLKRRNVQFLNKVRRVAFVNDMPMYVAKSLMKREYVMMFRVTERLVERGEADDLGFIAMVNPRSGFVHGYRYKGNFDE